MPLMFISVLNLIIFKSKAVDNEHQKSPFCAKTPKLQMHITGCFTASMTMYFFLQMKATSFLHLTQ